MAVREDGSSSPMRRLIGWLRGFLVMFVTVTVAGLLLFILTARRVLAAMGMLFMKDQVTRMASVELWVVLTTLLLVIRFLLDFFGPWNANRSMTRIVTTIEMLNYSMVHYTIGLMQLSTKRPNEYFQVWAVLLVTLQYSVKIGRPYSRSKQIPLLDLMSSFWTANLLRVQTFLLLRIPLWLIWALNATRIISYFSSTDKADGINQESNRFVADYMRYEHELSSSSSQLSSADDADIINMKLYQYVILGEDQLLKDVQEGNVDVQDQHQKHPRSRRRRVVRFNPQDYNKLITLDKIWDADSGESSRLLGRRVNEMPSMEGPLSFLRNFRKNGFLAFASCRPDQLKDVCLSFALYKLLRRRFYDLPLHEARLRTPREKIRRLIFKYILQDRERAFRVAAIELSFLQDLFYSKHATMFANGFPTINMVLSLMLVGAMGYIAYPVRYIPDRMDQADRNRITHGVFITRVIIVLIAFKEVAEIYMYVFSQWTKVLMLCFYVKQHQCIRRHWLVEKAMQAVLCFMSRGTWDESIRQHNLLISTRGMKLGNKRTITQLSKFPARIKLEDCTKKAIFNSLKELGTRLEKLKTEQEKGKEDEEDETELDKKKKKLARLDFYISSPSLLSQFSWTLDFDAETHTILVWHIATCLCEVKLASVKDARRFRPSRLPPKPFVKKPVGGLTETDHSTEEDDGKAKRWEHYITAASLSNYCMYLVKEALVPDNGIVAKNIFMEVRREINHVTLDGSIGSLLGLTSMQDVHDRLMKLADMTDNEDKQTTDEEIMADDVEASVATESPKKSRKQGDDDDDGDGLDIGNSLTRHGARLAKQLMDEFGEDKSGRLWEQLADFWTGFLLYLAAFTRASKHRAHLAGRRELTTHLWALLSHAGFLGGAAHGHSFLDVVELEIDNPGS